MEEESIILRLYFRNDFLNHLKLIDYLEKLCVAFYGEGFDELSYSIVKGNKDKDKNVRYNKKNVVQYLEHLKDNDDRGFQLSKYLDNYIFKSRDIKLSIVYDVKNVESKNQICFLNIAINKSIFIQTKEIYEINTVFLDLVNFLLSFKCRLQYGAVYSMKNEKMPLIFSLGIGNDNLTSYEEEKLLLWRKIRDNVEHVVWDITWGNLITKNHLNENSNFNDIISIAGKDNMVTIDGEICYFWLKSRDIEFEDNENLKEPFRHVVNMS